MSDLFDILVDLGPQKDETYDRLDETLHELFRGRASLGSYGSVGVVTCERRNRRLAAAMVEDATKLEDEEVSIIGLRLFFEDQTVGVGEIARRTGYTRQAVQAWTAGTRKGGFPSPVSGITSRAKRYSWPQVARWMQEKGIEPREGHEPLPELDDLNTAAAVDAAYRLRRASYGLEPEDLKSLVAWVK